MADTDRRRGFVAAAVIGALVFTVPLFFPRLTLSPPAMLGLIAAGGLIAALVAVVRSGGALGLGGPPLLGFSTAMLGAALQTLGSMLLLAEGHNPAGQKLALLWNWALDDLGWMLPQGLAIALRTNLVWLRHTAADLSVVSCIAVYSALIHLVPCMLGAGLGALLAGGASEGTPRSRNPHYDPGAGLHD
jgi:hypothetical protein